MKTDVQLFQIFQAQPRWGFKLSQLPDVGRCEMQSVTLKEMERRADGVIVPHNPKKIITVFECHSYYLEDIYARTVSKMVGVQKNHGMTRNVQGVIFFESASLDPQTEPWNRIIRSFVIRDEIARIAAKERHHPLVAVFQPMLIDDPAELERNATRFYRDIQHGKLKPLARKALEDVFVDWVFQRFHGITKKEIEKMLLKDLPPFEETTLGKDMIRIGKELGEKTGFERAVFQLLETKLKRLSKAQRRRIEALTLDQLIQLHEQALTWDSLGALDAWLDQAAGG